MTLSLLYIAAYCVVVVESAGRQIPMAFLERVKDDFNKRYGSGKAATAKANSLNNEFGYVPAGRLLKTKTISHPSLSIKYMCVCFDWF